MRLCISVLVCGMVGAALSGCSGGLARNAVTTTSSMPEDGAAALLKQPAATSLSSCLEQHAAFFSHHPNVPKNATNRLLFVMRALDYGEDLHVMAETQQPSFAHLDQARVILEATIAASIDRARRSLLILRLAQVYTHLAEQSEGEQREEYIKRGKELACRVL